MHKQNNIDYSVKVLELKDLRQHFKVGVGKRKIIVKAVDGISFDIYKRESLGLVGESGCGKTTTGRTIIKLYEPTGGTVHLNGVRVGAGIGSNVFRIKQAKQQAKIEKIEADDLKLEIYKRKQALKSDILVEETKISEIETDLSNQLRELHQPIEDYKNKEDAITSRQLAVLGDLEFAHKNKLRSIRRSEAEVITRRAKYDLYAVDSKFSKKLKGISDSKALRKKDRVALKAELTAELETIKADIIRKRDADIAKIESKLLSKSEIAERVSAEKTNYKQQVTAAKKDFNAQFEKLAETKPDMTRNKASVADARTKAEEKKQKHKITILELKAKAKVDINQIKENAKEKPELYKINQEKIDRVNRELKEKVNKDKIEIKEIKTARKSKEVTEALNKMQMIFQDPVESLNPRMTVKEIIAEGLRIQGVKDDELINEKVFEVLKIVGLVPEHAFRYPHEFSGGQRQRIGIARALIVNPDFIIADEPISALDVSIQAQVINLMNELKENLGLTILFIAHDLSVVKYFCDRIAVMYMGKIVELASSDELFETPLHPYTKSLLSAIPQPDPISERKRRRFPYNPLMHDYAFDKPSLKEIKPGHFIYANEAEYVNYKKEVSRTKEVA